MTANADGLLESGAPRGARPTPRGDLSGQSSGPTRLAGLFLEDLIPGSVYESPGRTITETDVVSFAGLSGDYNPIHTDAEFCKGTDYGQRVVYGVLGISVLTGLLDRIGIFSGTAVAMLKLTDWRFLLPVFIGDTVRFRMTIKTVRQTIDGAPGTVAVGCELLNQSGRTTQQGVMYLLVRSGLVVAVPDTAAGAHPVLATPL